MNTINPWKINNIELPSYNSVVKIKLNKNKLDEILFNIKYRNNGNIELITKNKNTNINSSGYEYLKLIIKNNIGYIDQISSSNKYSGSIYINLALQLLKKLNIKKCELKDNSTKKCQLKNGKIKYLDYKLINTFRFGETYYMKFGFRPINKITNKNMSNDLVINVQILKECTWDDIDKYFKKLGVKIINNRTYEILFNKALLNWNEFKQSFIGLYNNPFDAFNEYNDTNCYLFNEWLSYMRIIYEKKNLNNIINMRNIKYFDAFNRIIDIFLNVKWIKNINNNNI